MLAISCQKAQLMCSMACCLLPMTMNLVQLPHLQELLQQPTFKKMSLARLAQFC